MRAFFSAPRGMFLPGRRASLATSTVLAVSSSALVALAVTSTGYPSTHVAMHDGGVWVTSHRSSFVGEVNPAIRQPVMAAYLEPPVQDFDLVQDGSDVFAVLAGDKPLLRRVDVANSGFAGPGVSLPAKAVVASGGGVIAVLDGASGKLWVRAEQGATRAAFDDSDRPLATVGANAAMTVGADGAVYAVSPARQQLLTFTRAAAIPNADSPNGGDQSQLPVSATPQTTALDGVTASTHIELTAVGNDPVLLVDHTHVVLPGRSTADLPGDSGVAHLQQPSADGNGVVVATDTALYRFPLNGGTVTTLTTGGTGGPSAPVQLGGCTYAVWSTVPTRASSCGGAQAQLARVGSAADGPTAQGTLVLRVNSGRVVVNNPDLGWVYTLDDPTTKLPDFTQLLRQRAKDGTTSSTTQEETSAQARDRNNRPPNAQDDTFGARAGVPLVLPVLANDSDPDGDVLTVADPLGSLPATFGAAHVIERGRAVQLSPAAGATGTQRFQYTASDGRSGGRAQASVTVHIVAPEQNSAPKAPGVTPRVTVRTSGTLTYDVLQDWTDPDGDPMILSCPTPDTTITCTPDGVLTVHAAPKPGDLTVKVEVSDGRARSAGAVSVSVIAADSRNPLPRPDFATALVGVPLAIHPLDNDTGYGIEPLRLGQVTADGTASATASPDGTVTFTGRAQGTSYVTYTVLAGARTATSVIRVDVTKPAGNHPPVPAPDTALLRRSAPTDVDVLGNDVDPDGDVLVVTGVAVPPAMMAGGLIASVVANRAVRVSGTLDPSGAAAQLTYTVSDGTTQESSTITVRSVLADHDLPPVAKDDQAMVRAGGVASISVLDNDSDPEGGRLTLDPTVLDLSFRPSSGTPTRQPRAFGVGGSLRVIAPDVPGTVTMTYTARDPANQPASAYLKLQVIPQNAANNPPHPAALEARAIAGREVAIPVPLGGIDPDGDAVSLLTPPTQPSLGVVKLDPTRPDALLYTPRPDAHGSDQFTYAVADALGLSATATIRIGVAPPPTVAIPPVAVDDALRVRNTTTRTVRVAVLANDLSATGDPITFTATNPIKVLTPGTQATVQGRAIQVVVPKGATTPLLVSYSIAAAGIPAAKPGILTVTPAADAPLLPPIARDDVVRPLDATPVEVKPLANDADPDGSTADLTIPATNKDGSATVGPAGVITRLDATRVRVTPGPTDGWAWYTVTDLDGQSAVGLILVRGTTAPPHLRENVKPFVVTSGQSRTLALADFIVAPSGKPVRITQAEHVSASGATVSAKSATSLMVTGGGTAGAGAISVEVVDASSVNDPQGRRAYISIPITILPAPASATAAAANHPPVFTPKVLTVRRGQSATVDLEAATSDDAPDAGHHVFTLDALALPGVSATLSGAHTLTVAATTQAQPGQAVLTLSVSDPKKATARGSVTVTVVQTDLAPPTAGDCSPASGTRVNAGSTFTVDLAQCTSNPSPATPLKVSVGPAQSAAMGAAGAPAGTRVTIQVGATFFGSLAIPYTVTDGFGRTASARITAEVIAKPGPPGAPEVVGQPGNGTVALRWTAADPRGGTIDSYTITATGVSTVCGAVTQCQVSNLANGTSYVFVVTAHNQVGPGDPSAGSLPIMPDVRPDAPTGITATAKDASALLSWTDKSGGSPILQDVVTVTSTQGTKTVTFPNSTTGGTVSQTVPGLTNGVSYSFSVVSSNKAGVSDPTPAGPVVPAGTAAAPPAPTVAETGGAVGGQLTVSWNAAAVKAAANGQLTKVTIEDTGGAVPARDVTASVDAGAAVFDVQTSNTYHLRMTVTNNASSSASSAAVTATAEGTPAKPAFSGAPVAQNGAAQVSFGNVVSNGTAISKVTVNGGPGAVSVPPAGPYTATISGLTNGQSYAFTVTVCNPSNKCTTSDPSASVTPFGPPTAPSVNASVNGQTVTFSWGATNTNGYPGTTVGISIAGPGPSCGGPSAAAGSCSFTGQYSNNYSFTVTATNPAGSNAATSNTVRTIDPPVQPSMSISKGGSAIISPYCTSSACKYIVVNMSNFAPNTTYSVQLTCREGSWGSGLSGIQSVTTDGNGNASKQTSYYYGFPGGWVAASTNGVSSGQFTW